jgi:hypothetical protein
MNIRTRAVLALSKQLFPFATGRERPRRRYCVLVRKFRFLLSGYETIFPFDVVDVDILNPQPEATGTALGAPRNIHAWRQPFHLAISPTDQQLG